MYAYDLIKYLEELAPPGAAWENDNVGLQAGSGEVKLKNIFLCLELNEKALSKAINKKCNFIFTHHPLIFKPLKNLDTRNNPKAKLIQQALKHNITIYSAHTNLDFSKGGVSFELARTLKLKETTFLVNQESNRYKIVTFLPAKYVSKVSNALFNAGGGVIGEYSKCSFRSEGIGTFEGSSLTNPFVGNKQNFENAEETRLEIIVDSWKLKRVISALLDSHPYDEPAYDIYALKNQNKNYGFGVLGKLEKPMKTKEFFDHVQKSLKIDALKYSNGKSIRIKKVAVCGGSGSDLLHHAIASGADAFITADIKYHTYQDAENKIYLIDAGHYETEIFSLNGVKKMVEKFIKEKNSNLKVFKYSGSTNPVRIYNNRGVK